EGAAGATGEGPATDLAVPSAEAAPGQGIARGRGARATDAARVARARPAVDEGPAATLADQRARPSDNVNAELLAAQLVQSTVDASRRRGEGEGQGGRAGEGAGGVGSAGRGGRAAAHQPGRGSGGLDTSSRRYRRWYLVAMRRVHDRLVFPRARMLAMDQGLAVYRLQVRRNGTLAGAPRRVRSSGFPDMDAAAVEAIVGSAPFPAIPDDIAPDTPILGLNMTIEFSNPMVR
ncbi:MAG: TonB family protein, partial [Myxococcota bacterium]